MHIFLTAFSFSFTLNFILLSSAAFFKNGNKHIQTHHPLVNYQWSTMQSLGISVLEFILESVAV